MTPGDWVARRIGPFGSGVGGLLPHGFHAYARILHPAASRGGEPVRWDTIAAWAGRIMHPLAQFHAISSPPAGSHPGPPPWEDPPEDGKLELPVLAALREVLAGHTSSPRRCWHCLWDGYGWIHGSPSVARFGDPRPVPPAFPREVLDGPRLRLPNREYLLFTGPLEAAGTLGWRLGPDWFEAQSPNLLWPDDRAWLVATEIDLNSSYLGGPAALIDAVLADERLEAWPAQLTDPVSWDSDTINR